MNINRRSVLWSMAAPLPPFALAQDKVLPLRTPCLDHLDVVVPDFEATTKSDSTPVCHGRPNVS